MGGDPESGIRAFTDYTGIYILFLQIPGDIVNMLRNSVIRSRV